MAGNVAELSAVVSPCYLARMTVQELAQFYDGLRLWAPENLAALAQVADELRRRARPWTEDAKGAGQ